MRPRVLLMTRLDLFTAPDCPACPAAREAVASFARDWPDVVVREWDLTRDPGPAMGRGIVATPAVLVNDTRILLGVPDPRELAEAARLPPPPSLPAGGKIAPLKGVPTGEGWVG